MQKVIRWPGLIGFICVVAVLAAIVLLFLDTWIRLAAQKGLEQATGAEVNIASAEHQWSPFGVTLVDVQLTDPAKPTHNQLQAERISATVDLTPLLMQKVIVDELNVDGVQLGQPRTSEGAVYRQPDSADTGPFNLPEGAAIPSVDELLARSPLQTTKAAEAVEASYQAQQAALKQQFDALPSKETLKDYETRLKAFKETDYKNPAALAEAKKAFDAIKADLQRDKQALRDFKQAVTDAKQDLSPKLAALKAAPGQDYDQLKKVVAGDSAAIEDVTRMVFGDKAAMWSRYILGAMNTAAPMLDASAEQQQEKIRQEGRWYQFDDTDPLPDLLIRRATVSLKWQQESIVSEWQDITHQHDKLGRPTTFRIDSAASALWQSLKLNGNFALNEGEVNGSQQWQLMGLSLADMDLLQSKKLTTYLNKALVASSGSLKVNQGVLDGTGNIDLSQMNMTAQGSNNLTNAIASAVSGLNTLKIGTTIGGNIRKPDVSFSSDLDKRLGAALLNNLSPEQSAKLDSLKSRLNAMISEPLGDSSGALDQWLDWESLADGKSGTVDELLSQQLDNVIDKQKDKLLDKLKGKLIGNE